MITQSTYEQLKHTFGYTSSWALWSDGDGVHPKSGISDMKPFHVSEKVLLEKLNPNYIFVGLNPAAHNVDPDTEPWQAFHSADIKRLQEYKLRYALKGTKYWGAFMTDLLPNIIETNANKALSDIDVQDWKKAINDLKRIIEILKQDGNPIVIAFGNRVYNTLRKGFPEDVIVKKIVHFSAFIGKELYKERIMQQLKD